MIAMVRARPPVYQDAALRRELWSLVGKAGHQDSSRKHGRRGLNAWEITVRAAARWGGHLDYDKRPDLAENQRRLRPLMGIGAWQTEDVDFDGRRREDNLRKRRPETLTKMPDLLVGAGQQLEPKAIESVRGDPFVVETTIHYPTASSRSGDGLRKVVTRAARLALEHGLPGWRQHEHWLDKIRKQVRAIGRASHAKGREGPARGRAGYQELVPVADELLSGGRPLAATVPVPENLNLVGGAGVEDLRPYMDLTAQVCDTARRRVLEGETVPNDDKLFSIVEPHTDRIKPGHQPVPIQYGHNVLVLDAAVGLVVDYRVVATGVLDQDLVVPVLTGLQKRFPGRIQSASFDRAFQTPANPRERAAIVPTPCRASQGQAQGRPPQKEGTVAFGNARPHHPGVASVRGAKPAGTGPKRWRDRSKRGYDRDVALGLLGRELQRLGKLLLAQEEANCPAAKSKRKRACAISIASTTKVPQAPAEPERCRAERPPRPRGREKDQQRQAVDGRSSATMMVAHGNQCPFSDGH
jgi:hypothetical protein